MGQRHAGRTRLGAILASDVPLLGACSKRNSELLKISVDQEKERTWLRLEGRITGVWAKEFERVWREMAVNRDSKKFGIDLRGVTHMDSHARQILAEIHRDTKAEFLADSPITKFFAEEARRQAASSKREE